MDFGNGSLESVYALANSTPDRVTAGSQGKMKQQVLIAYFCSLIFLFALGCANAQEAEWQAFENARSINNLESQERALNTLRKIQSLNADSIYKGSSIDVWIERWEATVEVYEEREKMNDEMSSY